MSQPARRTTWRAVTAVVLALAVTSTVTSCSGGDDEPEPQGAASSSATEEPVATELSFGRLTGPLPAARKEQLSAAVQEVVDGWIDAAYLAGDYPRTDFADAWPGFTPGARALARRDADLMSNADIGGQVDGVEVERRVVKLDVVSHKQKPVGVTARVAVRFSTTGDTETHYRVGGRLYLIPTKDGWQVFGYDITKGTV